MTKCHLFEERQVQNAAKHRYPPQERQGRWYKPSKQQPEPISLHKHPNNCPSPDHKGHTCHETYGALHAKADSSYGRDARSACRLHASEILGLMLADKQLTFRFFFRRKNLTVACGPMVSATPHRNMSCINTGRVYVPQRAFSTSLQ